MNASQTSHGRKKYFNTELSMQWTCKELTICVSHVHRRVCEKCDGAHSGVTPDIGSRADDNGTITGIECAVREPKEALL